MTQGLSTVHGTERQKAAIAQALQSEQRAFRFYGSECERYSGTIDEEAANRRSDRTLLRAQSERIADRLEGLFGKGGGYSQSQSVCRVGIFSGAIEETPAFRRSNIIPCVAAEKRAPILKAANAFFGLRKKTKALSFEDEAGEMQTVRLRDLKRGQRRTWTVTFGANVIAEHLKTALREISRKISKASEVPLIAKCYRIHLRSFEVGSIYRKDANGNWLYDAKGQRIRKLDEDGRQLWHPHCHLLVEQIHWIPPSELNAVNAAIRNHFDGCWWDGGVINDLHEIIKYVSKPFEIAALEDNELKALHRALFKARLVEAYGELRLFRKALRTLKLRPIAPATEKGAWSFVESHNAHWRPKEIIAGDNDEGEGEVFKDPEGQAEDVVLALLSPQAITGDIREPIAIVNGYSGDLKALCDDVRFRVAWNRGINGWLSAQSRRKEALESDQRELPGLVDASAREIDPDTRPVIVREPIPRNEKPGGTSPPGSEVFCFWSPE